MRRSRFREDEARGSGRAGKGSKVGREYILNRKVGGCIFSEDGLEFIYLYC